MGRFELGEIESIIRPDGQEFMFEDGAARAVLAIGGRGAPGIEYQTVRGYRQQSETVVSWMLAPRTLSLNLTWTVTDRAKYWAARQTLQSFLRPNLGGDLKLRHTRADGTQREIRARSDSSPVFADDIESWEAFTETLSFLCFDPTFYDPTAKTLTFNAGSEVGLTFPVTFSDPAFNFPYNDMLGTPTDVAYKGEFAAWPVIDIDGPYEWVSIKNITTGKLIRLNQPIATGDKRHLDLTPGAVHIEDPNHLDDAGNPLSCFNELVMPDSDLLGFNLRPDGIPVADDPYEGVSGGTNTMYAEAAGKSTGVTKVTLTYYERYLSVA